MSKTVTIMSAIYLRNLIWCSEDIRYRDGQQTRVWLLDTRRTEPSMIQMYMNMRMQTVGEEVWNWVISLNNSPSASNQNCYRTTDRVRCRSIWKNSPSPPSYNGSLSIHDRLPLSLYLGKFRFVAVTCSDHHRCQPTTCATCPQD